jgi:hypothetical protein
MTAVVVTGPESSGTSLVSRILRGAGAQVFHRSATFTDDYADLPALCADADAVVIVYRDPVATMQSQMRQGLTEHQALQKLRHGYREIAAVMRDLHSVAIYCVTYEQLVLDPDSIRPLLTLLGLRADTPIEQVRDENRKYAVA